VKKLLLFLFTVTLVFVLSVIFCRYHLIPHKLDPNEFVEYLQLVSEQEIALRTEEPSDLTERTIWNRYNNIFLHAKSFANQISSIINNNSMFPKEAAAEVLTALNGGKNGVSSERAREAIDNGVVIFGAFKGDWRGEWHQGGSSNTYDHEWHTPKPIEENEDIFCQAVVMGEWDEEKGERKSNTIAINSVDSITGTIVGAVGFKNNASERPHAGYFVDENTLIWVALEGGSPNYPYYSLFYEYFKADQLAGYFIKGIGFTWDVANQKVISPEFKWGEYHNS